MRIQRYRNAEGVGFGVVYHRGDGYIQPSRRGWGYNDPFLRVAFWRWLWRVIL